LSYIFTVYNAGSRPQWSSGSVNVRGFKPGRGHWIFKGDKKSIAQLSSEQKVNKPIDLRHVKEPYEHERDAL
jgi:hypothetical protein